MSLPNYNLAPLDQKKTNILTEAPPIESGFIIALGTFFNDMKDFFWLYQTLVDNRPDNAHEISPHNGQFHGQVNFVLRMLTGIFWEFIELQRKNEKVFNLEAIQYAESRLTGDSKKYWGEMKRMALEEKNDLPDLEKRVLESLVIIRDSVSFHYYGTKNHIQGFENYCNKQADKAAIYSSLGDQLQTTRFYFADASTQFRINQIFEQKNISDKEVISFFLKISPAIRMFLESYLSSQSELLNGNREVRRQLAIKRGLS